MKRYAKRLSFALILIIAGFLVAESLFRNYGIGFPCVFQLVTGFYCPGCGITRSVLSLIHLEFYQAFRYNPFFICLLPVILWEVLSRIVLKLTGRPANKISHLEEMASILLVFFAIVFGVLRNLELFFYLAPTVI